MMSFRERAEELLRHDYVQRGKSIEATSRKG
jgi:hypothetical protein